MNNLLRFTVLAFGGSVFAALLGVGFFFAADFYIEGPPRGWSIAHSFFNWLQWEPAGQDQAYSPLDNLLPWGGAALAPLLWYMGIWLVCGRDRLIGVEFPRFRPPDGLSPAGVRQILDMGFDSKVIAAEMLSLAVRGYVRIERDEIGRYTLRRTDAPSGELTVAERRFLSMLFRARSFTRLHSADAAHLRIAIEAFQGFLEQELEGPVYKPNVWAVVLGIVISGTAYVVAAGFLPDGVPTTLDLLLASASLLAILTVNTVFFRLMKSPTDFGRELLDEIGGFRLFLKTAEYERMKMADSPELTAHLFAKYLPFALAMDIELAWSEAFARTVKRAVPSALDFDWYDDPQKIHYDMGLMGMVLSLGAAAAEVLESSDDY